MSFIKTLIIDDPRDPYRSLTKVEQEQARKLLAECIAQRPREIVLGVHTDSKGNVSCGLKVIERLLE